MHIYVYGNMFSSDVRRVSAEKVLVREKKRERLGNCNEEQWLSVVLG